MKNFDEIAKRLAILSDPCFRPLLGKRLSLLLKADHRCAQFDRSGDLERLETWSELALCYGGQT
jgi:hypothetical protein